MKIPGAEEADLRPSQLRDHRRLAQGRCLPGHAAGDAIEGANEIGNLTEDRGGDDLMLRHDGEFARHVRHPGGLERGVEGVGAPPIEHQPIFSSCWRTRSAWADHQYWLCAPGNSE